MKILYITSSDPEHLNGGSIGTKKFVIGLEGLKERCDLKVYTVVSCEKHRKKSNKYDLEIERRKYKAYFSRILGYADQLELYKKKILKLIEKENIEIVLLQSSRLGNISNSIKKKFPKIKIIQHFDNYEYEFATVMTKNMNILSRTLEKILVKKAERKAVNSMDIALYLTYKDKCNIERYYNSKKDYLYFPVFYENIYTRELNIKKEEQVIFTGSLDMEANIEGAIFLINNYKELFKGKYKLILAGRKPDKRIYNHIINTGNQKYIEIIENPSKAEMELCLRKSKIYISPVFKGSGMKTKIMEASFYGLPIIASEHSLIGYEFLSLNIIPNIMQFRDKNWIDLKEKIAFMEEYIQFERTNEIREFYKKNFSKEKCTEILFKLMEKI